MLWNGKIIGLFLGAVIGGVLGAFLGVVLGHCFDSGLFDPLLKRLGWSRAASRQANVQQIFFNSTFTIMGYLAKSDGRVSQHEIRIAKQIMDQLGLNLNMRQEAIALFNQGKTPGFRIDIALYQLRKACWNRPSLLRTFLEIQLQITYADGQQISQKKHDALQYICAQLGIRGFSFRHFENRYRAEQSYQQYQYQRQAQASPQQHLQDAYNILEVSNAASDADIKKAYRRQMSKNHPDKLVSKGLPPEMIKMATQKTQQIKNAYETIKKIRGLR